MSTEPLVEYDTQIADLRAQMAPLQRQLAVVVTQRRQHADRLAEATEDPQVLCSLREASQVAYRKFGAHVRAAFPDPIAGFDSWLPTAESPDRDYLPGPTLHYPVRSEAPADPEVVAEAMVRFAAQFCPHPPEQVSGHYAADRAGITVDGMVRAHVVDADHGSYHAFEVWYTPTGDRAYLLDGRGSDPVAAEGTLSEVLAVTERLASVHAYADDYF